MQKRKVEDVLGFALSGKTIHIILSTAEKKQVLGCQMTKEVKIEKKNFTKEVEDVNCSKCRRLSLFNDLLKNVKPSEPEKEPKEKTVDKKAEDKKPEPEQKTIEPTSISLEEVSKPDQEAIKKLRSLQLELAQAVETRFDQFMARIKSNFKFEIFHVMSKTIVFDNVEARAIGNCLFLLNNVRINWSGHGTPGSNFVTAMRKAFETGYTCSCLDYPQSLGEFVPEKKRTPTKGALQKLPKRKKTGRKLKTKKNNLPEPLPKRKKPKRKK